VSVGAGITGNRYKHDHNRKLVKEVREFDGDFPLKFMCNNVIYIL